MSHNYSQLLCYDLFQTEKNRLSISDLRLRGTHRRSLKMYYSTQITHSLPHAYPFFYQAKPTGYLLVLVPLTVFCIRCMIGAFHTRVAGNMRNQAVNESRGHLHHLKSMRWKSALSDITEADTLDSDSMIHLKIKLKLPLKTCLVLQKT
ncbi:hypothetical protein Dsin_001820 [Dipteronia sinensis]|uniref:Uncharacterized protein n=1 Tax=Dipteronia sinensis TaxID=43782 RepID=A0AAE0B6D4_9ROSI|nr:hypothetical protein Dsin_001820 [Dipteronia sinensis]